MQGMKRLEWRAMMQSPWGKRLYRRFHRVYVLSVCGVAAIVGSFIWSPDTRDCDVGPSVGKVTQLQGSRIILSE